MRNRFATVVPGLLILAGLGFAAIPLARGEMFYYWDNAQQHYPQTVFLAEGLRSGSIPHWWPDVGNGVPTVAEGQAAHYQPVRLLLAWLMNPAAAMTIEIGLYLALAGLGTFLFLRQFRLHQIACFVGGLSVMFGSLSVVFIRNMGLHRSLGLLPIAMLCAERFARQRSPAMLACAALVLGLQLLSGHPTLTVITMMATTLHVVFRVVQRADWRRPILARGIWQLGQPVLAWALALGVGIGVAAIQFFPQVLHVEQSIRAGGLTAEAAASLPALVRYLPQAVLPYAYLQGDWLQTPTPWSGLMNVAPSAGMYLGAVAVVLPVLALWWHRGWRDPVWAMAGGFAFAMLVALGLNTPLFPALRELPGISGLRYPSRFLFWAAFCLGCLTAAGLHRLLALSRAGGARARAVVPLGLTLAGVLALGLTFWIAQARIASSVYTAPQFRSGVAVSVVLAAAALGLCWALLRWGRTDRRRWLLAALALFATSDLVIFRLYAGYAPSVPIATAVSPSPVAEFLRADASVFRVMSLMSTEHGLNRNDDLAEYLQADTSALWGLDSTDVWYSLFLKRHYAIRESIAWELAHSPGAARNLSSFLASWNVKYVIAPKDVTLDGWTKVYDSHRAAAWQNPALLPRAFLVHQVIPESLEVREEWSARSITRLERYHEMAADWQSRVADSQIVDNLLTGTIDFRTTAVVQTDGMLPAIGGGTGGQITELRPAPADTMTFDVVSDGPALLVIATNFYPGWRATVDGEPARIWRANYTSMGIIVPAGRSRVGLLFATPGFRVGAAVSAISVGLCIFGVAAPYVRRRHLSARAMSNVTTTPAARASCA